MGEVARGPTYYILGWVSREEEERAHSHHPWYIGLIGLVVMVSIAIIYFKFFFKYCQTCSYNSPPLSSPSSHNRLDEYYFWRSFVNISLPPPPPSFVWRWWWSLLSSAAIATATTMSKSFDILHRKEYTQPSAFLFSPRFPWPTQEDDFLLQIINASTVNHQALL